MGTYFGSGKGRRRLLILMKGEKAVGESYNFYLVKKGSEEIPETVLAIKADGTVMVEPGNEEEAAEMLLDAVEKVFNNEVKGELNGLLIDGFAQLFINVFVALGLPNKGGIYGLDVDAAKRFYPAVVDRVFSIKRPRTLKFIVSIFASHSNGDMLNFVQMSVQKRVLEMLG